MPPRRRRSSSREASNAVVRSQELPLEAGNAELAGFKGRLHSVKVRNPLQLRCVRSIGTRVADGQPSLCRRSS